MQSAVDGDPGPGERVVGMTPTLASDGYWMVTSAGRVYAFGAAVHYGDLSAQQPFSPIIGIASTPIISSVSSQDEGGQGYWLAAADGSVYAFGDAQYSGRADHLSPGGEIVGIEAPSLVTKDGARSYWLAGADGTVHTIGNEAYRYPPHPSEPDPLQDALQELSIDSHGRREPHDIVDIARGDGGFWLLGRDGAVYGYGEAAGNYGDAAGERDVPAVGITFASGGTNKGGYWILFADGAIQAYGEAPTLEERATGAARGSVVGISY